MAMGHVQLGGVWIVILHGGDSGGQGLWTGCSVTFWVRCIKVLVHILS